MVFCGHQCLYDDFSGLCYCPETEREEPFMALKAFGIYLCHFIFVFMCFDLYDVDGLPYLIRIICTALTSFALSAIVVALMSSWKLTARFVR